MKDGLYYKDEYSFVFCSNDYNYVQPCSPGTRNSEYEKFNYGDKYSYRDFCDVNLVDGGYASHDGYGYEYVKPSYNGPKYEEPEYKEPQTYDGPAEPKYEPKYEPEPQNYDAPPKYEAPKYEEPEYKPAPEYKEPEKSYGEPSYGYTYHGKYPGKCEYDGLYYNNDSSFVFCVNGSEYVQPCSPGTQNSAYSKFSYGEKYTERDFCDVNLVDSGYVPNTY